MGFISERAYNQNRKRSSRQAVAALIEIPFE